MRNAKTQRTRGFLAAALAVFLGLAATSVAQGSAMLSLSEHSNGSVPAEYMSGMMDFTVSGDTLTLAVYNLTSNPPESFYINQLFFNATPNVTGLRLLDAPQGWELEFEEHDFLAGGFGRFDVQIVGGNGNHPGQVAPGGTAVFTMAIMGAGPFGESDFTSEFSAPQGGHIPSLAAAKFVRGSSNDDSSYGNAWPGCRPVPEPASLALMGLGATVAVALRRRRARA